MKKKSDEELGILLTREIKAMMFDKALTSDQKVQIFCAIVGDEKIKNPLLASYANTLKSGYIYANERRKAGIYSKREYQRNYARTKYASAANIEHDKTTIVDDSALSLIKGNGNGNNIPPTPKGVGRVPSAVSAEEIMEGRRGRKDAAAKDGRARDWKTTSGQQQGNANGTGRTRDEQRSGQTQDGRCVWCDGEGFCRDPDNNCQGAHCCNCIGKTSAEDWAGTFALEIFDWYPYKVNPVGLTKTLLAEAKKTSARAVADGIAAWRKSGAWDEPRFIPRKIMAWIRGGCYSEKPPQKKSPAAHADGMPASAAPSADATMRMIESEGEEE